MEFTESFWVGLSFIVLILLLFKPVGRIITSALDQRSHHIQHELDEALRLKEEAQEMLASYQRKHKEIKQEAAEILNFAQKEAERIKQEAHNHIETTLQKRMLLAQEKLARQEQAVIRSLQYKAIDISIDTTLSLLQDSIDQRSARALIDSSIDTIRKQPIT